MSDDLSHCFSHSPAYIAPELLPPGDASTRTRAEDVWGASLFAIYPPTSNLVPRGISSVFDAILSPVSSTPAIPVSQARVDDTRPSSALQSCRGLFKLNKYPGLPGFGNVRWIIPKLAERMTAGERRKKNLSLYLPRILKLIKLHALREEVSLSKDLSAFLQHDDRHTIHEEYPLNFISTHPKVNRMNINNASALAARAAPWFRVRHRARIRAKWHTSIS